MYDYNGFDISCYGFNDGGVDLSLLGGVMPYSYLWSHGSTSEDILSLTAGDYSVGIVDANGCESFSSITLVEPLELTSDIGSIYDYNGFDISCLGYSDGGIDLSVFGGVLPYDYNWSNGSLVQDLSSVSSGFYSVFVTDNNGCEVFEDILLTEPTGFSSAYTLSDYNGYNVSCYDGSDAWIDMSFSGSVSPYSYLWNNGSQTEDISALSSGVMTVSLTDANGCFYTEDILLTEPAPLVLVLEVDPDTCERSVGSVQAFVTGGVSPYQYNWQGLSFKGEKAINLYEDGVLSVLDLNTCEVSSEYVISSLSHPTADFYLDPSVFRFIDQLQHPIYFEDESHDSWCDLVYWEWDFGDGEVILSQDAAYSFSNLGSYKVTLTVENEYGCQDTISRWLQIKDYTLHIPNAFTPQSDGINDFFCPKGVGIEEFKMSIFNKWGEKIFITNDLSKPWDGSHMDVPGETVQIGVYAYKINVLDVFGETHMYVGEVHLLD